MGIKAPKLPTPRPPARPQATKPARAGAADTARASTARADTDFKKTLTERRAAGAGGDTTPPDRTPARRPSKQANAPRTRVHTIAARPAKARSADPDPAAGSKHAPRADKNAAAGAAHIIRRVLVTYHAPVENKTRPAPAPDPVPRAAGQAAAPHGEPETAAVEPARPAAARHAPQDKAGPKKTVARSASGPTRSAHDARADRQHKDKPGHDPGVTAAPPGLAAAVAPAPAAPAHRHEKIGAADAGAARHVRRTTAHRDPWPAKLTDAAAHGATAGADHKTGPASVRAAAAAGRTLASAHGDQAPASAKTSAGGSSPAPSLSAGPSIHPSAGGPSATPAPTPPAVTAALAAPIGSDAWNTALAQQSLRLRHGGGSAELSLHPRGLGPLQVSLTLGQHDQPAQLHFVSPHADVRAAVEAALPQLRHAFAAGGLSLGQASVSDQGRQQSQSSPRDGRRRAAGAPASLTAPAPAADLRPSVLLGHTGAGGIDIFA